jgi:multimeric flavodoxin WrbA
LHPASIRTCGSAASDEWPRLYERVQVADVLVVATPIWLGEKPSVCTRVIGRLYGNSSHLNKHGQYAYYGKSAAAS